MVKLAIIVLNFNTKSLTLTCLESIFNNSPKFSFEVVLVDNASTDGTVDEVRRRFKQVKIVENSSNLGFSAGNNSGLRKTQAEYYLLLNSDTKVLPNSLDNLVKFAEENSQFGIVSGKLLDPNGSFQPNAGELPNIFNTLLWLSNLDRLLPAISYQARDESYYKDIKEVGWVSGTAMLIKSSTIKGIGLLDERIFMYGEDVEYCFRASKQGFKVGWTNSSEVIHIGGGSSVRPRFSQWLGEFKGLLYIFKKYQGQFVSNIMKIAFYLFIFLRAVAFTIIGKIDFGRTYAKVAINL